MAFPSSLNLPRKDAFFLRWLPQRLRLPSYQFSDNQMSRRYKSNLPGNLKDLDLTLGLPIVVTRRRARNRVWLMVSAPFRLVGASWSWLMETRPKHSHKNKRPPPGFA
jgi:hypothetical protein